MDKIYTIKMSNSERNRYALIRFCSENEISVFLTWMQEDILNNILFADLVVPDEIQQKFELRFRKVVIHTEPLNITENG